MIAEAHIASTEPARNGRHSEERDSALTADASEEAGTLAGMSGFGLLLDPLFQQHITSHGHPERPARLEAIARGLHAAHIPQQAHAIQPRSATDAELLRVHDPAYLERLAKACAASAPYIDTPDSSICPASERIARHAAGGVIDAALGVGRGQLARAFCAVRPPGHHAERGESMGFCLYNNIALAARALQAECRIERILILDWDVHHGNGTQHIFQSDNAVYFISLHGHPDMFYPYTGYADERGIGKGLGYNLNITFQRDDGDAEYRQAFEQVIAPVVSEFKPQIILVSAGFDAHAKDPLGITNLSDEMYAWMTERVIDWADEWSQGRVVSVLEGGYDLEVLERCVPAHAKLLANIL